jgi:outer membrane receptor protein involved in Fe transport
MLALLVPLLLAVDTTITAPAVATRDSAHEPPPRVVVRLQEFVVHGALIHDPLSSESVRRIGSQSLRELPLDRLADVVALQAGVVARGEELHLRGGRTGELRMLLQGIELNEPVRGRPFDVPLLAVREAELTSGGLAADQGGALAGTLQLRTVDPVESAHGEVRWQTDGGLGTHYDRMAGLIRAPIPSTGLGVVASLEGTLDNTYLPALRANGRRDILGGSFGWRADNRMLAYAKLAHTGPGPRLALETLATRRVFEPYDPAWSLDGWTTTCIDPTFCALGPAFSPTEQPGYERYRAADHTTITDERRSATVLSWIAPGATRVWSAALGWTQARNTTSLDGRDGESYLDKEHGPFFGLPESDTSDPNLVYLGDEPYFRRSTSDVLSARADFTHLTPERGNQLAVGAGASYESLELREIDVSTFGLRSDSLRAYRAWAPGAFAYGQLRWVFEGLVANVGLRAEYFTAGPQSDAQSFPVAPHGVWSLSPRLGAAFPISVRDVLSFAYIRIRQDPERDFLYDNRLQVTNRRPIGNPALEPATVISYQLALKHLFSGTLALEGALFYRDLYGLVGARNLHPRLDVPLMRYENADDAHASGVEITLLRDAGERSRIELHYTYLIARGTSSREEGVPFGPRTRVRPESIGQHPLDWDRRHTIAFAAQWRRPRWGSIAWTTTIGSPLPWTPRERRQDEVDLSLENSRRFKWEESSALAARWTPRVLRGLALGLDVRNVFDFRGETAATLDGYPNPLINTVYDDYGAFRTETGRPGGAYWDDRDGDGQPGWAPVHDARLFSPPRAVRVSIQASF